MTVDSKQPEVLAWRETQLVEAGFSTVLAQALAADGRYDLHALIELAERGCAPELAAQISAPLDEAARQPLPLSAPWKPRSISGPRLSTRNRASGSRDCGRKTP